MQRSTWARSIAAEELNQRALRPSSIVAVGIGQKGAMASLRGFEVAYVWIAAQPGFGFGEDVNEGIVLGMNEQGRDADLLQAGGGAGARVIVVGAGKAAIESGDSLIELAQCPYPAQALQLVAARVETGFMPQPPAQVPQEILLVNPVSRTVQGGSGSGQIHRR